MFRYTHCSPVNRGSQRSPRWQSSLLLTSVLAVYLNAAGVTIAMEVISTGPQTIQKAMGDSVTLGCEYRAGPSDTGELDIEWSMVSPDITQKDQLIVSFTGDRKYEHGTSAFAEGVDFASEDPSQGDASITISPVSEAHTGTYQCKVRKAPGVDSRKVTVVVLVRPTVPKCVLVGSEMVGSPVSLQCQSSGGSTPLTYVWQKGSSKGLPPNVTQNPMTGQLLIGNHSESTEGMYLCEVQNTVGVERCRYTLHAIKPPSTSGIIVGTVVGSLLLAILFLLFIWFLLCLWDRRRLEKKGPSEIRVDALAPSPVARPLSRSSGRCPSMAYSSIRNPSLHRSLASGSLGGSFRSGRKSPDSWLLGARLESRCGYAV